MTNFTLLVFFPTSPSCGDRPPSLVFFFSFSRPPFLATDQPWRTQRLPRMCPCMQLVGNQILRFLDLSDSQDKKTRWRILLCSSSVLYFSLSCVKQLVGNKFFDGEVECQTEMATYVLFTVHTHTPMTTTTHFNLLQYRNVLYHTYGFPKQVLII